MSALWDDDATDTRTSTDTRPQRTPSVQVCADIVAALMKGPRTASELSYVAGLRGTAGQSHAWSGRIRRWLDVFRATGIVYISSWEPAPPGRWRRDWDWCAVYALQSQLFLCTDAPMPHRGPTADERAGIVK